MPPRRVAVIGASNDRRKYGNKAVRAYLAHGWEVHPVNPTEPAVEGLPAHAHLSDIPGPLDAVTMYVAPPVGLSLLPEIAAAQPGEVWFNPGTTNPEVRAEVARLRLPAVFACSIVALGSSPREFADA